MPPAAKLAHDRELISRLEREASRNPGAYRLRLAAIAIVGDMALTITLVLPWAAPILIGALWVHRPVFYWLTGATIVFLVWMLRPSFRIEGRELRAADAPRLFEEIARLRERLHVPGDMRVHLNEDFNASAAESRGLFGLIGTKRVLTLGMPLLCVLGREQALAVIAHEFGHFSRRHGRLGHWLYRARVGWLAYARHVEDLDSAFDRAAAWYAKQFVPYFSARCFVHSRQCEYEADADAAHAVGSRACAEALTRITVAAPSWYESFPRELARWQAKHAEPPGDFHERFARHVSERAETEIRSAMEAAMRAPSSWEDTHPSLSERLRALGEEPVLAGSARSAGEELLGASWPGLLREFDDKWTQGAQAEWLLEHLRLRRLALPLLEADEATARAWDVDRRLERATALHTLDPARGRAELQELVAQYPSHRRARFFHASALLDGDNESGVAIMESLAREDPALRAAAFARVLAYHERKGDSQQAERWAGWLRRVRLSLGESLTGLVERSEAGDVRPTSLSSAMQAAVAECVRRDPCIENARLLEGAAQFAYAADRPAVSLVCHLLVLSVHTEEVRRRGEDEERVADRYERLLRLLTWPDQVPLVRTFFTTEPMPSAYAAMPGLIEEPRTTG